MRWIICIYFLLAFAGCKRGNPQVVALRNLSSENLYFLISENKVLTNTNEIARIRPITSNPFSEIKVEYEDKEQAESIKYNLHRYLIEKDSLTILLSSESAGTFVNAITIQSIIKDRYNGELNIFIITENNLKKYSDQEIIDKKLYRHFKALTAEDIKEDTLILEYP